jgi:hypothetical protein
VARLLIQLGDAFQKDGQPAAASRCWQESVALLDALGDADADDVRARLTAQPVR